MEQISGSGTSFLERVLCTKKSYMPRCCFVSPHNSLFSLVLKFPSFWVKSLQSQTLVIGGSVWNKKCKCRRNAHAFERSGQSFGFPQIVRARTKNLCYAPSLAGTFRTECVGVGSRATHVIRLVHMRAPVRHNAIDLCQPRGALCTRNRARAHDLGTKNYVIASLKWIWFCRCSCSVLFVPHTSIRGNKEFFWD